MAILQPKSLVLITLLIPLMSQGILSFPLKRSVSSIPQIVGLLMEEQHLQASQLHILENTSSSYASMLPNIIDLFTKGLDLQTLQLQLLENATATTSAALPLIVALLENHDRKMDTIAASVEKLEQSLLDLPAILTAFLQQQINSSALIASSFETLIKAVPFTARDCVDIAKQGTYGSGPYMITPWDEHGPFKVQCDMETDDGDGWLVFHRRFDGSVDFFRGWEDYRGGFGDVDKGEYWLGLENLHRLTNTRQQWELRIDLEDFHGNTSYAQYNNFRIKDEASFYELTLGSYRGTAEDALEDSVSSSFSTKDQEHDTCKPVHCAEDRKGAWWYDCCTYANLNGLYLAPGEETSEGMYWYNWKESLESLKRAEMKIRPVN